MSACQGAITVASDTKIRQMLFLLVACLSLFFTAILHYVGNAWLSPALASNRVMAVGLYPGNKHVRFVPYTKAIS